MRIKKPKFNKSKEERMMSAKKKRYEPPTNTEQKVNLLDV